MYMSLLRREHSNTVTNSVLVGSTAENLLLLKALNNSGTSCILAPNHIKPQSTLRENMAIADDFPEMKQVLNASGIRHLRPVARGDMDIMIGSSKIKQVAYNVHRRIYSLLGKHLIGAFSLNINRNEPEVAAQKNIGNIRNIIRTLQSKGDTNVVIYPYGNWFESGEQDFKQETIWPSGHSTMIRPDEAKFVEWRTSLKRGAFAISRLSNAPLIPTYMMRKEGKTYLAVAKPLLPEQFNFDEKAMQYAYIEAMRQLKEETEKEINQN